MHGDLLTDAGGSQKMWRVKKASVHGGGKSMTVFTAAAILSRKNFRRWIL
jgi:hypothetical protein